MEFLPLQGPPRPMSSPLFHRLTRGNRPNSNIGNEHPTVFLLGQQIRAGFQKESETIEKEGPRARGYGGPEGLEPLTLGVKRSNYICRCLL